MSARTGERLVHGRGGSALAGVAPADGVRGDVYPSAAVHGGAGIFTEGVEIHDPPSEGRFPGDTDQDTGLAIGNDWVGGPSVEFLLAAQAEATSPGTALEAGLLRLDQLSLASGQASGEGRCILLPQRDEVDIEGTVPAGAGRLLLMVRGDAVLGSPGVTTELSGGLVVCGHLEIRGPLALEGTLHAGSLDVEAPVRVVVAPGWRGSPLPGATAPTLAEYGS